jgi:ABC-2 type transport system ATP-binding protein
MKPAVILDNLSVTLQRDVILKNIDLTIPAGKITGLIGPSGAGKTTLMRVIVGRQRPGSGKASVFDEPAGSAGVRSQLSYMTQAISIYGDLTVRENLHYFATMAGIKRAEVKSAVARAMSTVRLDNHAGQLVSKLSGGQKSRASLAVALLGRPKLLVLDEPTVGLDPVLREQLWELFGQLRDHGATLLISSHVMEEAERCDELVLMRDGGVLAHSTPASLRRETGTSSVEAAFLKLVEAA